jgi:hypothetical protein
MKLSGLKNEFVQKGIMFLGVLVFIFSGLKGQAWYNVSWDYRIPVTVSNQGGALTDFQVRISLDASFPWAHAITGGDDVRITTADGVTECPYWIEDWTHGSGAVIWARVPSLSASPASTVIYLYYGNPAAVPASDGDAVFLFFDDFESGSLDAGKWRTAGSPAYTFLQDGGSTVLSMTGTATHLVYVASNDMSFDNFILELDVKMTVDINNNCTPEIGFRLTNDNNKYITMLRGEGLIGGGGPNGDLFIRKYENGNQTNPTPYPAYNYTANVYYRYRVDANLDTINQYLNNELIRSWHDNGTAVLSGGVNLLNYGGTTSNPVYYDNVRIRRYSHADPGTVAGPEQNQYPPLDIAYTSEDVSCYGLSDGSVDVTVTGGSGVYSYLWTPGDFTTEDLTGVPAGTYLLQVEDANGQNIGSRSMTITQPSPLAAGYIVISPFDCITGLATIEVTATGGTAPYSGTGTFQQAAGKTDYTVTDAQGCQAIVSVTVGIEGSWFDPAWQHRMPVDIANPGGTSLADFQVRVSLDAGFEFASANTSGADIRFTASDGITALPYWIEEWNAPVSATLWVRLPAISPSGDRIYMYYGNSAAGDQGSGTATFDFFDDFTTYDVYPGNWIRRLLWTGSDWSGTVAHDWKYSMEMQHGALQYAMQRAANGWGTESLDTEIEAELDFMHTQLNPDGTVIPDSYLTSEPQYCYGLIMANLALGYLHFSTTNPVLSDRCYDDLVLVFDRLRVTYPTIGSVSDAGGYGMMLMGFANAWKAFSGNDVTRAGYANTIIQSYTATFLANQAVSGSWNGANGVQEHLKRNFGLLLAWDVTGNASVLSAVDSNLNYILSTFWISSNGGLEWYSNPATSNHFYECHQQWFMIAVRMLFNRSAGTYDHLAEGLQAWYFLTDNNYAGIDMYVHNYVNHSAFFSYRQVLETGAIQSDSFKGSYEVGTALWGMSLNYSWVSAYQSSHSSQVFNYLDEMVRQIKKTPSEKGFLSEGSGGPDSNLWHRVGNPVAAIVDDNGNNVLSIRGNINHTDLFASNEIGFGNFVLEARVLMTADGNSLCNPAIDFRYTDANNRYMTQMRGEAQNDFFMRRYQGGTQLDFPAAPFNYNANQYYRYRLVASGTEITAFLDDNLLAGITDAGTTILSGGISIRNYEDNNAAWFDDIRIRKHADPEPYAVRGTVESPSSWTGSVSSDWDDPANWTNGLPGLCSMVNISGAALRQPHISSEAECLYLTLGSGSGIVIDPEGALTVRGDLINEGTIIIGSTLESSGSLIVTGNSEGNITYNRQLKAGSAAGSDWHLAASPVTTNSDANTGRVNAVYQWSEPTGTWTTTGITSAVAGRGYNIRQEDTGSGEISFTGPPVNGDMTVEASSPYADAVNGEANYFTRVMAAGRSIESPGGRGWNLLGNPYPSAIRAEAFINANFSATPQLSQFDPNYVALYLFDGTSRRYYYVANSTGWPSGSELSETHIQAGQGFFVLAMNDNSVFTFTRAMQEHSTSTPMLKSGSAGERWPGLQLKVNHASGEVMTTVVYNGSMTTGVDPGYDIGLYRSGQEVEIYTTLLHKDNGINYTRQALPLSGADTLEIPVGIDCKKGGEVVFSASVVPVEGRRFWLEDRVAGTITELGLKSYTVNLPSDTYGTGRFFILASANTPTAISQTEASGGDLRIWISGGKLVIRGRTGEGSVCELFDVQGRKILGHKLTDGELNTIDLPAGVRGIIVVKVTGGTFMITRKLALLQ